MNPKSRRSYSSLARGSFMGAILAAAPLSTAGAVPGDGPYLILRQYVLKNRIYFIDALNSDRLAFRVDQKYKTVRTPKPLDPTRVADLPLEERMKPDFRSSDYATVFDPHTETTEPDGCELQSDEIVRVAGEEVTVAESERADERTFDWKDPRGFLHSLEVLKRQTRYNRWADDVAMGRVPLTGISDAATIRSDSTMLHYRLSRVEQNLDARSARAGAGAVCAEVLGGASGCAPDGGDEATLARARAAAQAAEDALASYDEALDRVPYISPEPLRLPAPIDGSRGRKDIARFYREADERGFAPTVKFTQGIGLGAVDCGVKVQEYPPAANEPEDEIHKEADPRRFGPVQEAALEPLKEEARRLVDAAAVDVVRLR